MSTKSKLVFGDEIISSKKVDYVNYSQVRIKSFDKSNGGLMKSVEIYIYILTLISVLLFILSK